MSDAGLEAHVIRDEVCWQSASSIAMLPSLVHLLVITAACVLPLDGARALPKLKDDTTTVTPEAQTLGSATVSWVSFHNILQPNVVARCGMNIHEDLHRCARRSQWALDIYL